ncbi:unnamed protein product [Cuscuta europaea]|uniref:Peptidase A1 domain-containing protein n=1 Tax=Cuscuta europaea TaxID=41803 RepID=A0A9P0Z1Q7_CUSEU|nr:unnamed protein product [Cuscuta europaea]
MASTYYCLVNLFIAILVSAASDAAFILPLRKDPKTLQHYTTVGMGSTRATVNAVIDLGGKFFWFDCDNYTSSTFAPIPCGSQECELAKGDGCVGCSNSAPRPGCTNNTCGASAYNPFQGALVSQGYESDTLFVRNGDQLAQFTYACMNTRFSGGLAGGASGILGLARTNVSLHKQVARTFGFPDQFSMCLPSSGLGKLSIGADLPTNAALISTPLIVNPSSTGPAVFVKGQPSDEYFIDVRGVKVDGQLLSVKSSYFTFDKYGFGGTKFSTTNNFTALHTSLYKPLVRAFIKAAADRNIKRVTAAAVPPFSACFDSATIPATATGPSVPTIELVLPGDGISWKMYGANSMFAVNEKVTCLAFVDGGGSESRNNNFPSASIVIGTHQLEDNLLEFDLDSSTFRFSSSLLSHNKTCSLL